MTEIKMDLYKAATFANLKFKTEVGLMNIYDLTNLDEKVFDKLLLDLESQLNTGRKSFFSTVEPKEELLRLKFDVAYDIAMTRKKKGEEVNAERENKKFNEKILALIAQKEEENMKNMSKEDLLKLLK